MFASLTQFVKDNQQVLDFKDILKIFHKVHSLFLIYQGAEDNYNRSMILLHSSHHHLYQGTLTEREGSVLLNSSLRYLAL